MLSLSNDFLLWSMTNHYLASIAAITPWAISTVPATAIKNMDVWQAINVFTGSDNTIVIATVACVSIALVCSAVLMSGMHVVEWFPNLRGPWTATMFYATNLLDILSTVVAISMWFYLKTTFEALNYVYMAAGFLAMWGHFFTSGRTLYMLSTTENKYTNI